MNLPRAEAPLRILLVDDNPGDRLLAAREVRRELPEARIVEVGDRQGFFAALEAGEFDAVVTDYSLGWSDGIAILHEVKRRNPGWPVILLTGAMSDEFAAEAMKAGLNDYVLKDPSRIVRLPGAVRSAIEFSRQQRAAREAEEALRQSERYFRALIEYGSDVILVLDPSGTIRYGSPSIERVLGHPSKELTGRNAIEFIHPDDVERATETNERIVKGAHGATVPISEIRFRHRDGSWRILEGLGVNVLDDPAVSGIVTTAHDITERRRTEEQLRRSQEQFLQSQKMEAVGRLAGGVAHDFNNLLTGITCFNDLALSSLREGDPLRRHGEEIRKAVARASSLTRQLLAFSRRQVLQPEIVNLNDVVHDMQTMLRRLIGEDLELAIHTDPALGHVRADPGQIEQVLMNLVVNARDAIPHGGTISIETTNVEVDEKAARTDPLPARSYVRLAVTDSGCGMDEQVKAHLFEPFFTTKEPGKGTGLGLPTVYGIVRQSEGYIMVQSEPNRGSTFKVYLPRVEPSAAPRATGVDRTAVASPVRGTETVLVVEDEEMVRLPVCTILRHHGYRVLEASRATDAISLSERFDGPIHLLFTDLVMPGLSGRELAERLVPLRPGMRVLYTSGYTDHTAIRKGVLEADIDFLQKPFSPDALVRRVRDVIDAPARR
jgi:PAS domain S-box-containing protein